MSSELEELVQFLTHGNTQIRQIAVENLVGFSTSNHQSVFKINNLKPIKDLKLLVRDYEPISKNSLTILINLSNDREVLKDLATDDAFLETLLLRITSAKEPNANEIAMLLANLAKSDSLKRILTTERAIPKDLSTSKNAMDQLMDCFVKGASGAYNDKADYDYLSYFLADIAKHAEGRKYFVTPQKHDNNIIPLTKLTVFTEHSSVIRRRGAASTIKNVCFDVDAHQSLMATDGVNILPYIILPMMGPEEYDDEDTDGMLEDLQLLAPDKAREPDFEILKTHLETTLLLTSTRPGREILRAIKVYPIIRETHLHVEDEGVREACDRVVQIIMSDEEDEAAKDKAEKARSGFADVKEVDGAEEEEDEDEQIIEVL
ncbi:dna-binding protein hgh1 [Venturia nashicola]|uniref:Protein HGH1 homolog n=1 Tax=Venturia nashicola TaxID=86259 RepID=A0A4Z1PHY6_9PEZI|nr:dna-binding protein hgh1 [Venturia nashicola]TLD37418.1 dna-binding protein hgh1 [Venturia nashicola]